MASIFVMVAQTVTEVLTRSLETSISQPQYLGPLLFLLSPPHTCLSSSSFCCDASDLRDQVGEIRGRLWRDWLVDWRRHSSRPQLTVMNEPSGPLIIRHSQAERGPLIKTSVVAPHFLMQTSFTHLPSSLAAPC